MSSKVVRIDEELEEILDSIITSRLLKNKKEASQMLAIKIKGDKRLKKKILGEDW